MHINYPGSKGVGIEGETRRSRSAPKQSAPIASLDLSSTDRGALIWRVG